MITVVLARGSDPGLLPQRAWRRLEQAASLYVDPSVAPSIAERLPSRRSSSVEEALAGPGPVVLVLNREPMPSSEVEVLVDPHPALAAAARLGVVPVLAALVSGGPPPNWDALVDGGGLLAIGPGYEGGDLPEALLETGLPPSTPVVLCQGSRARRTEAGDLGPVAPGDVVLVGVSEVREEARPLAGRRIVVTRAAEQAAGLVERLEDLGARVVLAPTIHLSEPEDPEPLRRALEGLGVYDWLIFTSPNAPPRFMAALLASGRDARALAGLRLACIGPSTARAVESCHLRADLVPDEYVAEGLLRALEGHGMDGRRVLLARAAEARDVLPETLRGRGAEVDVVPVYRTVPVESLPEATVRELREGVDLVTATASSVVRSFHRLTVSVLLPASTRVLAIGPVTAGTARELGYGEVLQAEEYTLDGLVEATVQALGG